MIFKLDINVTEKNIYKKPNSALVNFFVDGKDLSANINKFLLANDIKLNRNLLKNFILNDVDEIKFSNNPGQPDLLFLIKVKTDKKLNSDFFRTKISALIQNLKDFQIENLQINIPLFDKFSTIFFDEKHFFISFVEGIFLGNYSFTYKTKKESKKNLNISLNLGNGSLLNDELKQVENIFDAVYFTRDLVNEPANVITPQTFIEFNKKKFQNSRVSIQVLDHKKLIKLGMNSILSVGSASNNKPALLILNYKPRGKAKKKIALVGKGVTYDSGGLSLKPTNGMVDMKADMAGAAAVAGIILAVSKTNLPVEIIGIMPLVENMVSGNSYRPGDIIKSYSGKTIEVKDTDAEGRIILSDAITYACSLKPDLVIDYATLTGACVVALGEIAAGMFTNNEKYSMLLEKAGQYTFERVWKLPMWSDYDSLLESKIADISNLGPRWGGAITAAKFLEFFVSENTSWIHLDIAGPALKHKENSYTENYDTGFGVRLTFDFLRRLIED